jgi:hypothetical protein
MKAGQFGSESCKDELVSDRHVVYLLWHRDDPDGDTSDAKLLGVYSSEEAAGSRIPPAATLLGFAEHPEQFAIDPYTVDDDLWTSGHVEVEMLADRTGTKRQ